LALLTEKERNALLYGNWGTFQGQYFSEWRDAPDAADCKKAGITVEQAKEQGRWTHVIKPFDMNDGNKRAWQIYRSYDFGYARPWALGYYAIDFDGNIYRFMEVYGSTGTPNEGNRWTPDQQFAYIAELERSHPWLQGKNILGVADPSIWDGSRGISVADTAMKHGIYFTPGENERLSGLMQCRYRLQFDENGYAGMYVFEGRGAFRRTIPTLRFDERVPEDLDTTGEDHAADEWRYLCMARPVKPRPVESARPLQADPLNQLEPLRRVRRWGES
jgi:hypothetical protein